MKWISVVEKMISEECRGKDSEFLRMTGLSTAHLRNWRLGKNSTPQLKTIEKIESGLNITIETDNDGMPVGYQRAAKGIGDARIPSKDGIPESAQGEYDQLTFASGGQNWAELSDQERAYYEELYLRMELIIEEANAERHRRVQQAVNEFRKLMKDRALGISSK
jgi:transcriptional regulator with XRE-family HTH domain